jgi:hypothetical protein
MELSPKEKRIESLKLAMEKARGRLLFAAIISLVTQDQRTLKLRHAEFLDAQKNYIDVLVGKRKRKDVKIWLR